MPNVITKKDIREAYSRMKKYKEGKANLEKRIIENEQWWKMRHLDHDEKEEKSKSAWLFNSIANKHADAMDNYPEPSVLPRSLDDEEAAKQLSSVLPVILEQNNYEQVYSDTWWYKLKQGTGVKGVFWDKSKLNGLGDVTIKKVDLLNVFWEPGEMDIQNSRDFFCVELVSNEVLNLLYPKAKISGNGEGEVSKYIYDDNIDKTDKSLVVDWYYKKMFTDSSGRTQTKVHYVKFVNDYIIYASENDLNYAHRGFYDHGKYPFVFDTLFVVEGSPAGFGYIDVMKDCQKYIDELDWSILKHAKKASSKKWLVPLSSSVNEEEFEDDTKPFVHVTGNVSDEYLREITVTPLEATVSNHRVAKIEELKETSGNRDFSQGSTSSGVTAASAISALMEAGSKLSRDMLKSAYRSFQEECYLVIELIRQFYDEPRTFRITGELGKQDFTNFSNADLLPKDEGNEFGVDMGSRVPIFDINVTASKKSTYSKMSQNELAIQFYGLGFFEPQNADKTMACLEMMDFDGKDKLMQKIQENGTMFQQMQMMAQQIAQLSQIISVDHPELAPQMQPALPDAQSQIPVSKTPNVSQTKADTTKDMANNMANPN